MSVESLGNPLHLHRRPCPSSPRSMAMKVAKHAPHVTNEEGWDILRMKCSQRVQVLPGVGVDKRITTIVLRPCSPGASN